MINSVARPLSTQDNTQHRRKKTSMSGVKFEPTVPAFQQEKIFHASDRVLPLWSASMVITI
jgi:hypothetical protein